MGEERCLTLAEIRARRRELETYMNGPLQCGHLWRAVRHLMSLLHVVQIIGMWSARE